MTNAAVLVGAPGAGKSLLLVCLAGYLGLRSVTLSTLPVRVVRTADPLPAAAPQPQRLLRTYDLTAARRVLVGAEPYTTRQPEALTLHFGSRRDRQSLWLLDTTGLSAHVHPSPEVRLGQAATLEHLLGASLVLHVIDAAAAGEACRAGGLGEIDRLIGQLAADRPYVVLASKTDQPPAHRGFSAILSRLRGHLVIPTSGVTRSGMRQVRAVLDQHARGGPPGA